MIYVDPSYTIESDGYVSHNGYGVGLRRLTLSADQLILINVFGPDDAKAFEKTYGDTWPNVLCDITSLEPFAPDYDGTTDGDTGINILILRDHLAEWIKVATRLGLRVEVSSAAVTPGHYGDGGWSGVELLERTDGWLDWIE